MGLEIAMMLDAMKKNGTFVKVSGRSDFRKLASNDTSYYNLSLSRIKKYGEDAMSDHIPKLLRKDPGVKNPTFPERGIFLHFDEVDVNFFAISISGQPRSRTAVAAAKCVVTK